MLVAELKAHKTAALDYLYDNYSGALYGVILRIVQIEETAEEVLNDVFIKAWKQIAKYDTSKGRLYTWLVNIARNAAIDKIRSKELKNTSKTDSVADNVSVIDHAYFDTQRIDGIGLAKVMDQLSAELKFVIEQMYFRGYTQSEIAEEFDIPLGTVKTRTRAAMKALRALLL